MTSTPHDTQAPEAGSLEAITMRRFILRLVPFLTVCSFLALLDRVNVGFEATASSALGLLLVEALDAAAAFGVLFISPAHARGTAIAPAAGAAATP